MASLAEQIQARRLVLTAEELKQLSGWPPQVVEDYLAAIETILSIANSLDENNNTTDELIAVDNLKGVRRESDSSVNDCDLPVARGVDDEPSANLQRRSEDTEASIALIPARINRATIGQFTFSSLATDGLAVNTNTPTGATAYQLPINDETGSIVGYIPIYGSAW